MRQNNKFITGIIIAILVLGGAVAFIFIGRNESHEQVSSQPEAAETAVIVTDIPAVEAQEDTEPTQEVVIDQQVPPTPRVGLQSTDPETVNLASGEYQLIEAFAFW